jgi:hypothetical protein
MNTHPSPRARPPSPPSPSSSSSPSSPVRPSRARDSSLPRLARASTTIVREVNAPPVARASVLNSAISRDDLTRRFPSRAPRVPRPRRTLARVASSRRTLESNTRVGPKGRRASSRHRCVRVLALKTVMYATVSHVKPEAARARVDAPRRRRDAPDADAIVARDRGVFVRSRSVADRARETR